MPPLESFLKNLYNYLVGIEALDNNIIRKHTRKLETLGELSFPLDINSWHHLLVDRNDDLITVFEYASKLHGFTVNCDSLIKVSESWNLSVDRCDVIKGNCHLYLKREQIFKLLIGDVLTANGKYGSFKYPNSIKLELDVSSEESTLNLSELRLVLVKKVTANFLKFNNRNNEIDHSKTILFTTKSSRNDVGKTVVVCGPVLNVKGSKDLVTTSREYYRQRAEDMRLMAEHKYGLRVTAKPGWEKFFEKLGDAAVTIDLLQNKPSSTITVNLNDHYIKNASFILYNCARLAALFKEFDKKVITNLYPVLPEISDIDFSLLKQYEEWELLYVYILQFPQVIKSCIKDIANGRINIHYLISTLSSMTSLFSIYYRRVRILTDPRPHLFPVLHARIYLLKAIEQVLHNSLRLLDIEPVKQM